MHFNVQFTGRQLEVSNFNDTASHLALLLCQCLCASGTTSGAAALTGWLHPPASESSR